LSVQARLKAAFALMGVPHTIKTDNGPAYVSKNMQEFFRLWGVTHITRIPHNPQGQAIVECAHHT
ncbi:POK8 protein, partial [Centropus unirufus]|nr:POK8 protein [Centropus unirufus]